MRRIILGLLFLGSLLFLSAPTLAWLDCPNGKINDPYPGSCELYLDTNENLICDHSEPETKEDSLNSFFYPTFLTLSFYFLHWYLVTKTKLSKNYRWLNKASFRFFWNLVLLLAFIPTSLSALLFLLGFKISDLSFWHNQFGLVFIIVAFIHLLGRLQYFLNKLKYVS